MERYFDAFLYFANWGTHTLALAIPSRLLDMETVHRYCAGDSASVRERNGKTIFTFLADNDEPDGQWDDQTDALSALIPIRAQLARGDLRSLYIAWLRCAQAGELAAELQRLIASPGSPISSSMARTVASLLSAAEAAGEERRR